MPIGVVGRTMVWGLSKAEKIRQQGGVKQLAKSIGVFLYQNVLRNISKLRGGVTVRVNNQSADFYPKTHKEYLALQYIIEEERTLLRDLLSEIEPDDVFWDVGANLGVHSCLAGEQLTSGTVIAFEPYRPNAERLEQNRSLNDLDNITVVKRALSESIGTGKFSHPDETNPVTSGVRSFPIL